MTTASLTLPARPCPVCASVDPQTLFHQRFELIPDVSILSGYDVAVCNRCGCAYADRIPDQDAFDQYYRTVSKYEYHQRGGEESPHDRARMDVIAGVVAPLITRPDARILDIGCASGRLLYLLAQRGYPNVTGLDPSPACVETARRLYDVRVLQGHLSQFPPGEGPFDTVILVGVLEHIRDLDVATRQIRAITARDGIVYVEVPDVLEFTRWQNAPFQDFSVEHINFFSPTSLANLFARHGFTPVFSEQNAREQAHRTVMSNVSAAFRKTDNGEHPLVVDDESRPALERYIAQSKREERELQQRVNALVDGQRPIIVWGVGTNATRLLTTTRLREANITAFVDSNAKYHGKEVAGRPILSPDALRDRSEPIVIVSRVFQTEIAQQIRDMLGDGREIITLYDVG